MSRTALIGLVVIVFGLGCSDSGSGKTKEGRVYLAESDGTYFEALHIEGGDLDPNENLLEHEYDVMAQTEWKIFRFEPGVYDITVEYPGGVKVDTNREVEPGEAVKYELVDGDVVIESFYY